MAKVLDETDKAALISGAGASLVPLFLQSFIPGGPVGVFVACILLGFGLYKVVDKLF